MAKRRTRQKSLEARKAQAKQVAALFGQALTPTPRSRNRRAEVSRMYPGIVSTVSKSNTDDDDDGGLFTPTPQPRRSKAEIEAEVAKRVAERMAAVGVEAPAIVAEPKSLSSSTSVVKEKSLITRHDPAPSVSKGMNGLADWLSAQISGRTE